MIGSNPAIGNKPIPRPLLDYSVALKLVNEITHRDVEPVGHVDRHAARELGLTGLMDVVNGFEFAVWDHQ
jgi:hypothetical protein